VSALASLARWRSRLPSRGELRLAEAGVGLGWWVAAGNSELGTARAGAELGSAEAGAELGSVHAGAERWRSWLPARGELGSAEAGAELGWWAVAGDSELGTARAGAELGSAEAGAELGSAHAGAGRGMAEGSAGGAGFEVMRESARLNSGRLRSSPTVRTPHGC